eukprot:s1_g2088.t1
MTDKKPAHARRAEIIAATRQILTIEGAGALSLRGVASSVGIKLASLQYHFPTRADLVTALVDDMLTQQKAAIKHLSENPRNAPQEKLDAVLRWFAIETGEDEEDSRLEVQFWALAQIDDAARHALAQYHNLYVTFLAGLIQDAVGVSKRQATLRAVSIASLLEGAILFVDLADPSSPGHHKFKTIYESARNIAYGDT